MLTAHNLSLCRCVGRLSCTFTLVKQSFKACEQLGGVFPCSHRVHSLRQIIRKLFNKEGLINHDGINGTICADCDCLIGGKCFSNEVARLCELPFEDRPATVRQQKHCFPVITGNPLIRLRRHFTLPRVVKQSSDSPPCQAALLQRSEK